MMNCEMLEGCCLATSSLIFLNSRESCCFSVRCTADFGRIAYFKWGRRTWAAWMCLASGWPWWWVGQVMVCAATLELGCCLTYAVTAGCGESQTPTYIADSRRGHCAHHPLLQQATVSHALSTRSAGPCCCAGAVRGVCDWGLLHGYCSQRWQIASL
ncbi:hypothetical protein COO60DRAFT_1697756 [Scenedesmus sp. NREL 46B-D3]|nr:hypothetical protein COO60DRAFT_1697756 [Scenedesmus sp. NREL 46B-D3]